MALFAFQHFTCKQFYARILGILGMGRGVFLQQELSDLKGGRYFTYYSRMQCKKIELCSFKPEFSPSQFDAPLRVHLSSFLAFVCLALCATFYFLLPKYVSYETQKVWKKVLQKCHMKTILGKIDTVRSSLAQSLRHVHTVHTYRF